MFSYGLHFFFKHEFPLILPCWLCGLCPAYWTLFCLLLGWGFSKTLKISVSQAANLWNGNSNISNSLSSLEVKWVSFCKALRSLPVFTKNYISGYYFVYYSNVVLLNICKFCKAFVVNTNFYNWNIGNSEDIPALSRSQFQSEEIDTHCVGTRTFAGEAQLSSQRKGYFFY